ncbi:DUF4105 domain-containing protein [Lysobacter hankyongensis]|uniref:DUF4105 domain-containing protein n=1 Tax=Lysobacter hankyongensis TaxID=1176535 RepID=A0ABP9AN89_9GAMM
MQRARRLLIGLCALFFALAAQAAPRIGVATMQPGEIFFERFGHNAIVVDDPATNETLSYNFGFFDMEEAGFMGRFIQGDMRYYLARLPWRDDLQYYLDSGRGVRIQWLDLTPAQAEAMAAALAENAKPENARYRYDYFTDNCATRVRDAVDRALGGALKPQLVSRSQGNTYRNEAVRLASPASWMWLGFDIGLGPASDMPLSRWEDAYVPMRLADSLREARLPDGRPLVLAEDEVAPHRIAPEPAEFAFVWWRWLLAGLAIAALWSLWRSRAPRSAAAAATLFWLASATLGTVMLLVWLGTEHRFGWANRNLLLLSPLCWLLLPGGWRLLRGRAPGRLFRIALATVAVGAVLAPFAHWVAAVPQANGHWIALLLPIHAALALAWLRPRP